MRLELTIAGSPPRFLINLDDLNPEQTGPPDDHLQLRRNYWEEEGLAMIRTLNNEFEVGKGLIAGQLKQLHELHNGAPDLKVCIA